MNKKIVLSAFCCAALFIFCDISSLLDFGKKSDSALSEKEIIEGLKQSLILGSKTAAFTLNDTSGTINSLGEITGYLANEMVKILLPDDVENAYSNVLKLRDNSVGLLLLQVAKVDLIQYKEALIKGLNRGAEHAAALSVDIFTTAITSMTISSAKQILFGDDSIAATNYLKKTCSEELRKGFRPIIDSSLSKVQVSAMGRQYSVKQVWEVFSSNYNLVCAAYQSLKSDASSADPLVAMKASASLKLLENAGISSIEPLTTDLVEYATEKALYGLFFMVGKQELKIRRDPVAALNAAADFITSNARQLIEKVFSSSKQN